MIDIPCWCDWRCEDPRGCVCIFHGRLGDYDCGLPRSRADIHRVAAAGVRRGQPSVGTLEAWVMEVLDAICDGRLADTHGVGPRPSTRRFQ